MRRHARASFAASTSGTGNSRARFGGAFATRGASGDAKGSGASAGRSLTLPTIILGAMLLALILPGSAGAAIVHPFKEAFGSATQPSFTEPHALAVDPDSGNLLVVDAGAQTLSRFKPNGEPAPFSALGTHVIDAKKGIEGKPCGEEPASCDETPQNSFSFGTGGNSAAEVQVAVDNSGNPLTDGNIYVTQVSAGVVDIFGPNGHYIGQIDSFHGTQNEVQKLEIKNATGGGYKLRFKGEETTELASSANSGLVQAALQALPAIGAGGVTVTGANGNTTLRNRPITFGGPLANQNVPQIECVSNLTGTSPSCPVTTLTEGGPGNLHNGATCGVAVDSTGKTFVGDYDKGLHVFSPTTNPPTAADNTANFNLGTGCALAAGAGPTSGSLFFAKWSGGLPDAIVKVDAATGETKYTLASGGNTLVTVNPSDGHVLAASGSVVTEYDASGPSGATEASTLTAPSAVQGVAVNPTTGNVYISRSGGSGIEVFGTPVSTPTTAASAASDITATKATLNGTVDAEGTEVTECFFEYGPTAAYGLSRPCAEPVPSDSNPHPVSATISGLEPSTTYHYRLVAKNLAGPGESGNRTMITAGQVVTEPATAVAVAGATLHGSVNPAGKVLTDCSFQFIPQDDYETNGDSFSGPNLAQTKSCTPSAGAIEADFQSHAVSAVIAGLAQNTTYRFRLVVTTSAGTVAGQELSFTTLGAPQIAGEFANPVGSSSATLTAEIDPSGSVTTYRFEWGTDASYGKQAPAEFEPVLAAGTEPVKVTAKLNGLTPATTYHFRIVASSASGTSVGPGWQFMTLDASGAPVLPNDRAYELVSPPDKRPTGVVGSILGGIPEQGSVLARAAEDGGSLYYPLLNGIESSNAGGFLRQRATRNASGWLSTQVSSPSLIPPPGIDSIGLANPSAVLYISPDLGCAILRTHNPLTEDTPATDIEQGMINLYRWNGDDGSYELISNRVPLNPNQQDSNFRRLYEQVEAADDCSRVYFRSNYEFLSGASELYEWEEGGSLRDAGVLPNGAPGSGAVVGGETLDALTGRWDAVSPDGSHFFFSAISNEGPDSGTRAVFMREDGGANVVNISQSETAVPTTGARFEAASPDGSRVFFRANYGIADTTSSGPTAADCGLTTFVGDGAVETARCDLYEYEVDSGELTDLSADVNPVDTGGAVVQGTVAVDEDGSHVYFAAMGQLIPGEGRTFAQNSQGKGSANIYLADGGQLSYVSTLGQDSTTRHGDLLGPLNLGSVQIGAALMRSKAWASSTTPDGQELLFVAAANLTGYESGPFPRAGVQEAYLYSAGSGELVCISCRPDGQPSVHTPGDTTGGETLELGIGKENVLPPVARMNTTLTTLSNYRPRSMSDDGNRVFFTSPDVLAPGGVARARNVYMWEEGHVSFLAFVRPSGGSGLGTYLDASADGDDVFIATSEQLVPQDFDFVSDVYDVRVDGGFPADPPPVPCDLAADRCQGSPASPPAPLDPQSSDFVGAGNPPAAKKGTTCRKGFEKRRVKGKTRCVKVKKKNRSAKSNRGGSK